MKMNILGLIALFGVICVCHGYKFLLIFPYPVRSLNILGEGCVKHLLNAGHEVTYITVFPLKNVASKNLVQIDISETLKCFEASNFTIAHVIESEISPKDLHVLRKFTLDSASEAFQTKAVVNFFADKSKKFDAVIADFYETDIFASIAALYDCPMIWSYSMGAHLVTLRLLDGPTNPAYVADYLSSNIPPLTFTQRIEELWSYVQWSYIKRFYTLPEEQAMYKKVFEPLFSQRGKIAPPYEELVYNVSLILANDHVATGNIPKIPINFKFVGGQHIDSTTKPLPKDLQLLMDNAKNGVIYFSMGSTWQSKDIPKVITQGLLKIFGQLTQTVIWKYEDELDNLPNNVHTMKWAPQLSILGHHPNCRMFITHGGMLSSIEAVHFGVPIIGVPIYLDQFVNINKAVSQGYALSVELNYNLPDQLLIAINTMLSNNKYAKRAKELSMVYHDRLVSPGAELVYWVEHVVRTRGAPHLRSPALHVPWYQKTFVDLILILALIFFVSTKIIIILLRSLNWSKKEMNKKKHN